MADERNKNINGSDYGSNDEAMASTAPGIPDEALGPGEELPTPPSDAEVERIARAIGAPTAERDTLPLEGE